MSALSFMRMLLLPPLVIEECIPVSPIETQPSRIDKIQAVVERYLDCVDNPSRTFYKEPFVIARNYRKQPHVPPRDKGYVNELSTDVEFLNSDNLLSDEPYYESNG